MRFIFICLLLASCTTRHENELVVVGNDTFITHLDTQHVKSSHRINPRNVAEEASPKYQIITDRDTFESGITRDSGTTQVFMLLKRISQ